MAASRPARPLLQEARVIDVSDENGAGRSLLLEMAFQTKRRVAFVQQALVDGPVRRVADRAALPHRLMWVNKRAPLLCVTFETGFVATQESKAAGFERLLNVGRSALDCDSLVHLVTISAAHFAFQHRMVMRQLRMRRELPSDTGNRFPATLRGLMIVPAPPPALTCRLPGP